MPITEEMEEYFSSDLCVVKPDFYIPIGKSSTEEKSQIRAFIKKAISDQPSHTLTGLYSLGNIENRPYRHYAIIGDLSDGGILLNVEPNRSWTIAIDYNATEDHYNEFERLLSNLSSIFLFGSGSELISIANSLYEKGLFDKRLKNNVYELQNFEASLVERCNPFAKVITHPTDQPSYLKVKEFYNYKEDDYKDIKNTHVIIELDNELVAGARSNEEVNNSAVIGGVRTRVDMRGQKLGFTVCYHLVEELQTKLDHIFLETDVDNFPAIRIYEKLGFIKIGESAFFEKGVDMISQVIGDRDY